MKNAGDMTLAEKVGQVIVVGGAIGGIGHEQGLEYALRLIRENRAGGFYLGYPRYRNPSEAWRLNARLQAASEMPLFLCADMETSLGYVIIEDVQRHPYLMGLGAARDEALARECGAIVGREARALGFNWNYGPCVDVNIRKEHPAMGIRSFGGDPELVSRLGRAYIEGCQSERVMCCAKHFPGQGTLAIDTHDEIGVDHTGKDTLVAVSIPPFQAAIRAGVKTVMSHHAIFPALGDDTFPATLSKKIATDLLRGELGFKGLTITDSLSMKAIADNYGTHEAVIASFLAGWDTIMVPASWRPYEVLIEAAESGRIPQARLDEAVDRVLRAKRWLYPHGYREPDEEEVRRVFRSEPTGKTLQILALKATTVIENRTLPLDPGASRRLIVIQERDEAYQYCPWEKGVLDRAEQLLREREPTAAVRRISMSCAEDEAKEILQAARGCDEVIFLCIAKHLIEQYDGRLSRATAKLLSRIAAERGVIGICLGSPYVVEDIAHCAGFICTYGESDVSAETAIKALYGELVPPGKLPVAISPRYPFGTGLRPSIPGPSATSDWVIHPRRLRAEGSGPVEASGERKDRELSDKSRFQQTEE